MMDHVDANDGVIGVVSKKEVYEKKLTHRIVHVFVLHPKENKIYLQKRSEKMSYLPGYYCTSAGGHVGAGETYENAAKRELQEEIGLNSSLERMGKMNFLLDGHDRFIELFITKAEDGFSFADGEVADGAFFSIDELQNLLAKGENIHPQLELCFNWMKENKPELLQ